MSANALLLNPFQGPEHEGFTLNGGEPAAIFVHGFPGTPAEMRPLAETLHQAGWTTQAVLLPGFGKELGTITQRHYEEWVGHVRHALVEMQRRHKPVILVGHSMGGAVSILVSSRQPPDGLVLLAPFWNIEHVVWSLLPLIRVMIPEFSPFRFFTPDFSNPEFRKGLRNFFPDADLDDPQVQQQIKNLKLPIALFDELRRVGRAAYNSAPIVHLPTLIIQGTHDDLVRPSQTRKLSDRLQGALHYVEVPGDHNINIPKDAVWRRVTHVLVDFARQIEHRVTESGTGSHSAQPGDNP